MNEGYRRLMLVVTALVGGWWLLFSNEGAERVVLALVYAVVTYAVFQTAWWIYSGFSKRGQSK